MFAFDVADRTLSRQFSLVRLIRLPSIQAKCSEERQKRYFGSARKCFELGMKVATEAEAPSSAILAAG